LLQEIAAENKQRNSRKTENTENTEILPKIIRKSQAAAKNSEKS